MKLKTKVWLVSQSLLVLTAIIIQLTFYGEMKLGPLLGMPKRDYWDIIRNLEPEVPKYVLEKNLPPKMYDARLPSLSKRDKRCQSGSLPGSLQTEVGLRMAFKGGFVVNIIYLLGFHLLCISFYSKIESSEADWLRFII